jgi:hypothetical protein
MLKQVSIADVIKETGRWFFFLLLLINKIFLASLLSFCFLGVVGGLINDVKLCTSFDTINMVRYYIILHIIYFIYYIIYIILYILYYIYYIIYIILYILYYIYYIIYIILYILYYIYYILLSYYTIIDLMIKL